MKIDPNAPAYPSHVTTNENGVDVVAWQKGMSIRAAMAKDIMAAFLADGDEEWIRLIASGGSIAMPMSEYAKAAIVAADALIAALNAEPRP